MDDPFSIQQLLNRYSINAGRRNWDAVVGTFIEDGVWSLPGLGHRLIGREAIKQTLVTLTGPMVYIVQMNTPAEIEIQGDRATASSGIREFGRYADRDEAMEVLGFYDDDIVRTEAGWRFAQRTFTVQGMHSVPLASVQS